MEKIIFITFIFIGLFSNAQTQQPNNFPTTNAPNSWYINRGTLDSMKMFIERDTFYAKYPTLIKHLDHNFYYTNGNGSSWIKLNGSGGGGGGSYTASLPIYINSNIINADTGRASTQLVTGYSLNKKGDSILSLIPNMRFTHDVTVNLPAGTGRYLGAYYDGDVIPLTNKPYDSLVDILAKKCLHPTYNTPSASIGASPSFGGYEYGTNLGTVTLSSYYTQNDGGANTGTTYYMNGSPLGGNTVTISSLTSTQQFYVNKSYGQGAVKNNNCGQADPYGQIQAGNVNSGTSSYYTFFKRYYGWVNSTSPSNSDILALNQDNNGGTASLTLSNVTPSGSQYLVYFTKGTVSSVTVNGIPATGAFTITTYSVTNAQGATTTYSYVYSNNAQTSTLSTVVFN